MRATALGLLLSGSLLAQDPADDPFGHSRHGAEFDEGPRQAAYRMPGLSTQVHMPVAGLSADAQQFFDQGVCQQHGFWYFEAERSFRQVAKLHPECAMAYWGMAMANVENWKRAAGFAAQAVQRSKDVPEREKLWIDAIAAFYQIDDTLKAELQSGDAERIKKAKETVAGKSERDEKQLHRNLVRGFEAVAYAFPEDVEAKAFLAIQSWRNLDVGLPIGSHGAVDALLDAVFAKAPLHPAHHYRVHLWDREKHERALGSAAVLGSTAPGIAHQWHMAGHIYYKANRNAEAAWQQEASSRVDHAFMAKDAVMPFLIHNYGHNQEWLCRSLSHVGRARDALDLAKNMAELPRHPKWNKLDSGDDIAGYARERLVDVCEDYELWEDAVALCRDGHLESGGDVRHETVRLLLLGRALFRLGRLDEGERVVVDAAALLTRARAERAAAVDKAEDDVVAKKESTEAADKAMDDARRDRTDVVRAVLDLQRELRGEKLLAAGDAKGAVAEFLACKAVPRTLLADAHVAAGEPDKAIELLAKDVKEHPHRVPTAGRLFLALVATNKDEHNKRISELMDDLPCVEVGKHTDTRFVERLGIQISSCRAVPTAASVATAATATTGETLRFGPDFGPRPPLASLGPFRWSPTAAPGFDLPVAGGGRAKCARGRPSLAVFYLGFGCLHCVKQLEALSPMEKQFADAGIDVVAIGNETLAKAEAGLAALGDQKFPFPLLADPELAAFRAWRCYDDFEEMPLHGTFLVDGDGKVRWSDVSFEPFTQLDWLLGEARRLLALPANAGSK